jgi:hypothetical protein
LNSQNSKFPFYAGGYSTFIIYIIEPSDGLIVII